MNKENTKEEAIPQNWKEEPQIEEKSYWVQDGENVYPERMLVVNGALFDLESAHQLRDELTKVLADD